ncbi:MAG: GTPase [Flavobacteriaceae bacterium]|nr:GTPase [Flavobacteriaceae bacterium]MDZ4146877.1 GTPase [Flavobacteriaceae bacterium]
MKNQQPVKYVFVYNAQSGRLHGLMDAAHKLLSPSTYACKLCALTYDVWSENETWKTFRESFPVSLEFLHIDEFKKNYPEAFKKFDNFPFVLMLKADASWEIFISREDFEKMASLEELMAKLRR